MKSSTPPSRDGAPIAPLPRAKTSGIVIAEYQRAAHRTDRLGPPQGIEMSILGLFGEVGSLVSILKKKQRDKNAFSSYDAAILEELGDILWYFTNTATRAGLDLAALAQRAVRVLADREEADGRRIRTFRDFDSSCRVTACKRTHAGVRLTVRVVDLAGKTGDLLNDLRDRRLTKNGDRLSVHLVEILCALVVAAHATGGTLEAAARGNLSKIFSRWPTKPRYPAAIDDRMPKNERLPRQFTVFFEEQTVGDKVYVLQNCNGIFIGDRLTDNKTEKDDYRFHDVFHFAYAVHLGWSPVLRALFRVKRKSEPDLDENQDGARAILIEEGVSTFIFGRGLDRGLFRSLKHVDYDLLKSIQEFVRGYEVERCALWQWERAILDGFRMFRDLKKHRRGYVKADLVAHTLKFREGGG